MPFRVADEHRSPAVFNTGRHVLVDASGLGQGRYCMAAVCMEGGTVVKLLSSPCAAHSSVLAEQECIEWAFEIWPNALVWNDCIPAIEAVLVQHPSAKGRLFWPTPRMRKPFHDLAHQLSVSARALNQPRQVVLSQRLGFAKGEFEVPDNFDSLKAEEIRILFLGDDTGAQSEQSD